MRLRELEAKFLVRDSDKSIRFVDSIEEAQGIMFLCPKCFHNDRGAHQVICWFRGKVPDDVTPGPGRWNPSGTGLDDLTFVPPGAVSVWLSGEGGCGWHGFVVNGEAQ